MNSDQEGGMPRNVYSPPQVSSRLPVAAKCITWVPEAEVGNKEARLFLPHENLGGTRLGYLEAPLLPFPLCASEYFVVFDGPIQFPPVTPSQQWAQSFGDGRLPFRVEYND